MKVVAINGSPRPMGNTYQALKMVCDELNGEGLETEIIHVGNMEIKGCISCGRCEGGYCIHSDDKLKDIVNKIYDADGLLLGSPVYYAGISGTLKSFLDRLFYANHGRLRHKVASSIAVPRRSGGLPTFDQMNHYFLISEMLIAPSYYWNVIHGGAPGEVQKDSEGVSVLNNLARNMAWMIKMKEACKVTLPPPDAGPRSWMNFVR